MRQTEVKDFVDQYEDRNFYQITFPEDYIFAHSRHTYIDIDELRDQDYVPNSGGTVMITIQDEDTNKSYSEYRRLDERGKATFDISRFLQIFMEDTLRQDADFDYNDDSKIVARHVIAVKLKYGGVYFWEREFEVVNGADEVTDCWWNKERRLKWWVNYPFTFDFRNIEWASAEINNSGLEQTLILPQITPYNSTNGRIRINTNRLLTPVVKVVKIYTQNGMGFLNGSFGQMNNTVVIEARPQAMSSRYIYLRWLNRHGELNYWLFNRQSLTRKTKATDSQRAYVKDERFAGYGIDNALLRTLTVEGEIKCFTDALDGIDYEIVRQIFTAPFVDLYLPEPSQEMKQAQWQRVHIKAETQTEALRHADKYTYTRQVTITLTLPEEGQLFV